MSDTIITWAESPMGILEAQAKQDAKDLADKESVIQEMIIALKLKIVDGTATQEDKDNLALLK